MNALVYSLQRHHDVSGVSGEGPVGTVVEFDDGHAVLHWDTATPSTSVFTDIRHVTALHGHGGASTLELHEPHRLIAAYEQATPLLLHSMGCMPLTIGTHPDHPDRLRVTFSQYLNWDRWITWLGGSTDTAVHEEVNGEIEHRWVSADGNLWLSYYTPIGSAWERHDDPEENR